MSSPAKKIGSAVSPTSTPKLTVVPPSPVGSGAPGPDKSLRIIIVFLVCVFTALGGMFLVSTRKPVEMKQSMTKFTSLHEVYRQEGLEKFLEAKKSLKEDISRVLSSSSDSESQSQATNIAVYLFPDILPSDDFERSAAMEDWYPLEQAIEKAPRTPESRAVFEELRANIWNYENPERSQPNLSATAKEVIRIYEELSAP